MIYNIKYLKYIVKVKSMTNWNLLHYRIAYFLKHNLLKYIFHFIFKNKNVYQCESMKWKPRVCKKNFVQYMYWQIQVLRFDFCIVIQNKIIRNYLYYIFTGMAAYSFILIFGAFYKPEDKKIYSFHW